MNALPETFDTGSDFPLRGRIEELATRLILEASRDDLAADLVRLSEMADSNGYEETARVAAELAERMSDPGDEKGSFDNLLRDGIVQLQHTVDDEFRRNASAAALTMDEPQTKASSSLAQDPELVRDFITESREHLASIESRMLVLEQNPADAEAIHAVFRGFHTIKGLAGFLEYPVILQVAHEVETLLDLARNDKLAVTPPVVDMVLGGADYLKLAIAGVEASLVGQTPPALADHQELLSRIRNLSAETPPEIEPMAVESPAEMSSEPPPAEPGCTHAVSDTVPKDARSGTRVGKTEGASSLRVDTTKLDYLMDMVGEMVIAQSMIRHNPVLASVQDFRLQSDLAQLARITNEVQRTAMGMRMIPVGQLFQRAARQVRDLSRKTGKQVELEIRGEDTEIDKTIAEELSDPLMHMVRNAIDHGIESPEVRASSGKSRTAGLRLAAYHQGGLIVVEISDDGRGLDREKILQKARQNGVVEAAAQLTESEIFHLIFEPGFSTADHITDISGRGVGMDVVRKHIQKLRGRIDIESRAGLGTTFLLKLPLTLAIIEGLVVAVGDNRYIVPIFAVKEMFRPTPEALSTFRGRDEMVLVRGRLLPIIRLCRRFNVQSRSDDLCAGTLVVAECEGKQFCLLVDELVGKQEVVIKALGENLKNIAGIAGGAILGDGRVGLILDMEGVFRGASLG